MKTSYLTYVVLLASSFLLTPKLLAQLPNISRIDYQESTHVFQLLNPPVSVAYAAETRNPFWKYRWEFGDGHFSDEPNPTHHYARAGTYQVRLYLTPHYSSSGPQIILGNVSTQGGRKDPIEYNLGNRSIYFQSNTPSSLVPGHEFQVALMYGNEQAGRSTESGYLFFFYNKADEIPVSYKRLSVVGNIRAFHDRQMQQSPIEIIENQLSGKLQEEARQNINDYEDVVVFKVDNLRKGEYRNIFLSLRSDLRLLKMQNKNRTLSIAALFAPSSGDYRSREHQIEQDFAILAVHDPNRIRVKEKKLYYHRLARRELNYTLDFQNTKKGSVDNISVRIPLSKGINPSSAKVEFEDPYIPECPTEENPDITGTSCFTVAGVKRKKGSQDSLILNIYNIGLRGKRSLGTFQSKRSSKGKVLISLKSDSSRVAQSSARAYIYFDKVKPIRTNIAKTSWRRRTWFLRPQFELELSGETFFFDPEQLLDRFGVGLALIDTPLGKGISKGLEASYTPLSFSRQFDLIDGPDFILRRKEFTRLHLLDLNMLVGYQINGAIRLTTGLGVSIPIRGQTQLLEQRMSPSGLFTNEKSLLEYGILASDESDNVAIFNGEKITQSVGGYWRTTLEFGLLDRLAVGISQDMRYYPKLYFDKCGHFRTYSVFARIRLADGKRF